MFNFLTWLIDHPIRKCGVCGALGFRCNMTHLSLGLYICDLVCKDEGLWRAA